MNDELRAWITAINANPSQSGRQVELLKDETNSTNVNYFGFTIKLPGTTATADVYMTRHSSSTANVQFLCGSGWSDNGSNGGYGNISGSTNNDTAIGFRTASYDAVLFTAYGTVDGQEFFIGGFEFDNTTYSDPFIMGKMTNGEWAVVHFDATSLSGLHYNGQRWFASTFGGYTTASTSAPPMPGFALSSSTVQTPGPGTLFMASPDLYYGRQSNLGNYMSLGANDYIMSAGGTAGLWVRYAGA
ncbi:MAG: hypothetical protein ACO3HF_01015 [Burkholderiaceae bacterium]